MAKIRITINGTDSQEWDQVIPSTISVSSELIYFEHNNDFEGGGVKLKGEKTKVYIGNEVINHSIIEISSDGQCKEENN